MYVTGHLIWEPGTETGTEVFFSEIGRHARGQVFLNTIDLDDDRLDGPATSTLDWDISGDRSSKHSIHRGTLRIENEAGAWEGPWPGIGQYQTLRSVGFLTGSRAYEGLSATLVHVSTSGSGGVIEGAVYPTDIASCDFSAE